jgi:3-hydroxyisobutyrate dehydrogenase
MANVGIIGIGRMGQPMALNLLKAGHRVRAFDVGAKALAAIVAAGAERAASPADAAAGAEAVITMLPAGPDILAVYGEGGLIAAAAPGTLLIDCSSVDVASAKAAHALAAACGLASLDAPVSGGVGGAVAGTLTLMCGGSEEAFRRAVPILKAVGKRIIHCGEAGAGQIVKMCNQMMVAANMAVASEAFVLAERHGIAPKVFYDVITTSSGGSWALESYAPVEGLAPMAASNNGFAPGFTTKLMVKDLRIFQSAVEAAGVASPVGARATALYEEFLEAGGADRDYSAVIAMLREEVRR